MNGRGYWKAPRALRFLLEQGHLSASEYALLIYVAQAGADREEGLSTSYAALASVLGVSEKTVKRGLEKLREQALLSFEIRRGQRRPFTARLGTRLRVEESEVMSEVVSEVTSDSRSSESRRNPASAAASRAPSTSDTTFSRAAPTETETEEILATATSAYVGAGGSLTLPDWREALERNVRSQLKRGVPAALITAAAGELGRDRAFPGYLAQRIAKLSKEGPSCDWRGLDRRQLTASQLGECDCRGCKEWLAHREGEEAA